jgi:cell division protein FtsW
VLAVTAILATIGIVAVYSASFAQAFVEYQNVNYFMIRQTLFAIVGALALVICMRLDYRALKNLSTLMMLAALFGLVAVIIPGVGVESNGSRRWIPLGPLPPLQPSEMAKLALLVYLAAWLSSRGRSLKRWGAAFFPFVAMVGLFAALVLIQPDLGTTLIIVLTTVTIFFMAGAAWSHLVALVGIGLVMAPFAILTEGYRLTRFMTFVDPNSDPQGAGFHITQIVIALGSGGLSGLGLGESRQKFFYVPGAHTDGIFAIIGEEVGFIGCVAVVLLLATLVYRGFRIALTAHDEFGALLAGGITSWLALQALINLGGVTQSIPLTGIPMPLLSYGGSALISTMAAIGILLSVSRYARPEPQRDNERWRDPNEQHERGPAR